MTQALRGGPCPERPYTPLSVMPLRWRKSCATSPLNPQSRVCMDGVLQRPCPASRWSAPKCNPLRQLQCPHRPATNHRYHTTPRQPHGRLLVCPQHPTHPPCATKSSGQVANVLIANAARLGAEGPAMVALLGDYVASSPVRIVASTRLPQPRGSDPLAMCRAAPPIGSHPPQGENLCHHGHHHSLHSSCPTKHLHSPSANGGWCLLLGRFWWERSRQPPQGRISRQSKP